VGGIMRIAEKSPVPTRVKRLTVRDHAFRRIIR
jgi:hypothetical protein